jgi:hypothetical protein
VFGRARESGRYICKESESIAHDYHHSPSLYHVHGVF